MSKSSDLQIETREQLPLLLNQLNLSSVGAEIGVQEGLYSETILQKSNLKRLYSIDCWKSVDKSKYIDIANKTQLNHYYKLLKTFLRLRKFKKRSRILREFSKDASKKFKDESLDFAYIDAQHSYEACKVDINLWWPKIKKGGVLAGHDYINGMRKEGEFEVKKAVDEFVKINNLKLFVTNASQGDSADWPSWYLIKR